MTAGRTEFDEFSSREWLICKHNGAAREYAFPPERGTYKGCYLALRKDLELVPAEGIDLALIVMGAYTQNTEKWEKVRRKYLDVGGKHHILTPMKILWVPSGNEFEGIFIEKNIGRRWNNPEITIPKSIDDWKRGENGIFIEPYESKVFVPAGSYRIGEHDSKSFPKDGLATAVLTVEGAEIFARVTLIRRLKPWIWGNVTRHISKPKQDVVCIERYNEKLGICGDLSFYNGDGRAFGRKK